MNWDSIEALLHFRDDVQFRFDKFQSDTVVQYCVNHSEIDSSIRFDPW